MNVVVRGQVKSEFSSLPVAVRLSEMRVLKLPIVFSGTGTCELSTILLTMWNQLRKYASAFHRILS